MMEKVTLIEEQFGFCFFTEIGTVKTYQKSVRLQEDLLELWTTVIILKTQFVYLEMLLEMEFLILKLKKEINFMFNLISIYREQYKLQMQSVAKFC